MWDTPGILRRDLSKLRDFAAAWLDPKVLGSFQRLFTEVIWPTDFWDIIDPHQVDLAQEFAAKMESCLGITSRKVSFQETWARNPPQEAAGQSLPEYIDDVSV